MSRDKDRILGHAADNDGIEEYDNALPDWWLGLFAFTVVWGVGYLIDYHFVSHRSQAGYYEAEMAAAKERWPEATPQAISFDEATVAAGAKEFATTCVACHGAELGGGIGPSLVDATWIHGSEPDQIRATVTNGVLDKGMPSWGPVLGPDRVAKVVAFVYTKAKAAGGIPAPGTAPAVAPGTPTIAAAVAPLDPNTPETGETVFKSNCVVCHGEDMLGKVGPNLIDTEWIHGGKLADIEKTITIGVPEKGMVSWGPILGPERIKMVAEYVHSKGSAPQ
ncbi:MAG: c-type cytochrome [Myxococcota bacterium]